jgi:hypothetical protein
MTVIDRLEDVPDDMIAVCQQKRKRSERKVGSPAVVTLQLAE